MEKYIKNKMQTVTKKHTRSRQPVPAARPIHPVTNPLAAQPPPRATRHAAHARVKWKTMCPGPDERFRRGLGLFASGAGCPTLKNDSRRRRESLPDGPQAN